MLEHAHPVADANPQRPAGTPFPDHDTDDRRLQTRHLHQVDGDQLSLAALLRTDAGECTRRVDQTDDRQAELRRQAHGLQGLAVALRVRTTIQALVALRKRVPLLLADQHDTKVAQASKTGPDGTIVPEGAVAVQLDELLEDQ